MTHSINIVIGMVRKRINQRDKNFIACFVGETGGGKSSGAIVFACGVDPTFASVVRVVFTPAEFLREIIRMKKGEAVVFDEAGVGISSREWQKIQVKLVGFVAQLFRHKNLCVIFTVPSMGFIEKQTRTLTHAVVHFRNIDYDNKLAIAKWYVVNHDPISGVTNYDSLKVKNDKGEVIVDPIYFPQPDEEAWKRYVAMKEKYAAEVYESALKEAQGDDKIDARTVRKMKNQVLAGMRCIGYLLRTHTWKDIEKITQMSTKTMQNWINDMDDD